MVIFGSAVSGASKYQNLNKASFRGCRGHEAKAMVEVKSNSIPQGEVIRQCKLSKSQSQISTP